MSHHPTLIFTNEKDYLLVSIMGPLLNFTDLGECTYRRFSLSVWWFPKWMMELHPASNTVGGSESAVRRSIAINIGLSGGWLSLLSRVHRHQQHYDDRFPWEGVSNKVTVAWAACGCQTNRTCDSTLTGTLQRSSQHCNRNANILSVAALLAHSLTEISSLWHFRFSERMPAC